MKKSKAVKKKATKQVDGYTIGKNYLIRTVTLYYLGRLVAVTPQEFLLEDVSWVADTGRFADALKSGTVAEVEPYPDGVQVHVGRGALVDASEWQRPLPRVQK